MPNGLGGTSSGTSGRGAGRRGESTFGGSDRCLLVGVMSGEFRERAVFRVVAKEACERLVNGFEPLFRFVPIFVSGRKAIRMPCLCQASARSFESVQAAIRRDAEDAVVVDVVVHDEIRPRMNALLNSM